jgi:CubicO group peptidase (beta-lactamase class C family)
LPPPPPSTWPPADEQALVDGAVQPVMDGKWVNGLVVGVADAAGPRIYAYGGLDGDSLVELGATTEVFTGLLFADAIQRGLVQPTDPVKKYLPPEVTFPESLTLEQLATHTSGLPRNPDNVAPADPANPFADYTTALFLEFVGRFQPPDPPAETFSVSNVGTSLLALALAPDYEATLVERILGPLGMQRTRVHAEGAVQGHDGDLVSVGPWDFDALAAAGGLRSTANEMVSFLGQSLGFIASPLAQVLQAAQVHQTPNIAFGWHVLDDGVTLWHDGRTGGCYSFVALDPERKMGVVVLSDTSSSVVADIGKVVLGKLAAPQLRPTAELSTFLLDQWVGRYRLERGLFLEVTREEDHLMLISPGEPPARLYAENAVQFYMRVSDLQITFNDSGLVLRRGEEEITAPRARR